MTDSKPLPWRIQPVPFARLPAALMLLVALVFPAPQLHAHPAGTVQLRAGGDEIALQGALTYVEVPESSTLAEARKSHTAGKFRHVPRWPPTFGFSNTGYWFHLRIENVDHPESAWILAVRYALLDHADLYVVHEDGSVEEFRAGDRVAFSQRALRHRHPTFPILLAPGEGEDLFLRVAGESSMQVPLELMTMKSFLQQAPVEHLGLGIYYGIMVGLFFYNLILFLSIRDRTFLLYVLYVALFAVAQFCLNGLAFQYWWPDSPDWGNAALLVAMALTMISMLAFSGSFLGLRERYPAAYRAFWLIAVLLVVVTLLIPVLGYRLTIQIVAGNVFVLAIAILTAAVKVYLDGYTPARNFLLAWSMLLIGVVVYAAVSFGALPKMFITEYGIQIGSAAEMILLSFALAYRINVLRDENSRIQREAREQLEARVAERTAELDVALSELQSVNRSLHDFSLRDGLTGVHNRRHFDQTITDVVARARERGEPVSLLMADLDHFKQINDRHGHDVGDDCLRAVAKCMSGQLRFPEEYVVRFGGEEFVLVLPGIDAATALARAEKLRAAVAELPVCAAVADLGCTVSVGVSTIAPDSALAHADLLRISDRALYEAKRQGRNRVVAHQAM